MPLFRFTLDGTLLTDEPEGWDKIISELRRDKEVRGQLLLMDLTLAFRGNTDGYDILKPKYDCEGFCSFSTLQIEQFCDNTWTEIYDGILFYTLIKEYLSPCILECKLKDNSFAAKIDNNKNIEAYVNVGRSKNDEAITAAASDLISMFEVTDGSYTHKITAYPVSECFRFIIEYMTDGEMGFTSDYFTTGEGKDIYLTTGQIMREYDGNESIYPFISFQKLFDELHKKINLGFSIEDVAGVKTMRVEDYTYFYQQTSALTLSNVRGIVKSANTSELYSKLEIGASETLDYVAGGTDFPTGINFVGWNKESYTITGKCNIDNTLNLVSDWIIDSNIIQAVYSGGETDYDEDIFLIMADSVTLQAIQYDVFSTLTPIFYNGFFRNSEVATRWFGNIPNSIALYLGSGDDEFQASSTSDVAIGSICSTDAPFQDDFNPPNFDTNGNYNNVTYGYTVPTTGFYSFQVIASVYFAEQSQVMQQNVFVKLYVNAVLHTTDGFGIPHGYSTNTVTFNSVYLQGGDVVTVRISDVFCLPNLPPYYTLSLLTGSIFKCFNTINGGNVFQYYDPEDFKAYQYEFDYPISFADFQTIIADPLKQITVDDGNNEIIAWIDNMKYNHKTGMAKFVLTNAVTNTDCE